MNEEKKAGKVEEDKKSSSAPSISLPKGGGAIRGIGEKFAANPVTGTGSLSIPIATSPGRAGCGPQLSLSYDSGSGNSLYGFGWNLSLPAITRKTDKGLPRYLDNEESDVYILSGSEDLVPVLNSDGSRFEDNKTDPDYTIHRYRPRIEGLFARIERWANNTTSEIHWRSITKDNILTLYGKDNNSRIFDPAEIPESGDIKDAKPVRIFSWLICETRDGKGNAVLYDYKREDGVGVDFVRACERNRGDRNDPRRSTNRYLKQIRYGNRTPLLDNAGHHPRFLTKAQVQNAGWMFEVVFDYGEHDANTPEPDDPGQWDFRDDPFSSYRSGFEVRTTRLCQRALMFHHIPDISMDEKGYDGLVRSTDFTYSHEQDPTNARNPVYTFLRAVAQTGYKREGSGYLKRGLPPVEFKYTQPIVQDTVEEVDPTSLKNLTIGVDGAAYQWTDLHGEGIPGILTEQADAWFYKRNLSPIGEHPVEFAPLERVAAKPNVALAAGAQFMDLAGDGYPDLVALDSPTPGLYEHDDEEGWQPFRPFTSRLNRNTRDPNLKFVDLNGDGHADILITEDDAFVWHASLAEEGFGPARRVAQVLDEEKGPSLIFADGTQSIYLADFSGDGLTDLVRIRNGEACYWPNLGYGRFGTKVTMDHSPHFDHPDQFDHKRIRLADIDGTGTTDIIYLHREGVRLYFNQSGNSWSDPQILSVFPRVDDLVSIVPTDLLGNGTACLVWSSPLPGDARRPMRYVNLMGGQKPHLLVKTVNNLGAETRVQYAPSTKFYLQDKRDGKLWITRLPFPVHVVECVETYDHISRNRFVTRYAYHHGYFDGEEREFRGFGMVEQWDTEEFAALSQSQDFPTGDNIEESSHVPPVLIRTWFHTGAYLGRSHISNFFAGLLDANDIGEYYREPSLDDAQARELFLDDTVLPAGLSVDEEREACRALKGSMLRQEVYALDGTDKEPHPYTVTEQNFTIRCLQTKEDNQHSVFFTHARESINYHYERNPVDPRISHAMMLEVDDFGNVLKEVAIGYGRRQPDMNLSAVDQAKQTQPHITYTENRVTNVIEAIDDYRTPLPCEIRTYELTGHIPTGGQLQISDLVQPDPADPIGRKRIHTFDGEVDYKDTPPSGRQRRLIEHLRTLYRPDDMGVSPNDPLALLPLGTVESLALPGETYKLAFTPGLLTDLFGNTVTSAIMNKDGKYVHFENDNNWWIPSGRVFYSTKKNDSAQVELDYANNHFFLPHRFFDPFGQTTTIKYDGYDLQTLETTDPLDNKVTAGERDVKDSITSKIDYRVLQPSLVTGPNGNRSEVAFDTLGLVAGTAVMGKAGENKGDSLAGFKADLTQNEINSFFANPKGQIATILLGDASTRIIYDESCYYRLGSVEKPVFAATIARETHASDPLPEQGLKLQTSFSYSDGFSREIQKKIEAEPGPLDLDDPNSPHADPRWVGSGWTIFNNKDKPIKQYEPFFDDTHDFRFGKQVGVSPTLFYDPVERVVATLHPNHTCEKVVFDPWRQETWDVNDTVLQADPKNDIDVGGFFERIPDGDYLPSWYESRINGQKGAVEKLAAEKAADHNDTPTVAHFDSLGRTFLTVADNGQKGNYETRVELDIEGNQRAVIDAKDRIVMQYDYNLLSSQIRQVSMETGTRLVLNDVEGKPIYGWDSRGHRTRTTYDELQRPTGLYVSEGGNPEVLAEKTVYGETLPKPKQFNHHSRVYQVYDGAGVVTSEKYDFKGNLISGQRQLLQDYKNQVDWTQAPSPESEIFLSSTQFDALNRAVQIIAPHSDQGNDRINVIQPTYNEANLLEGTDVWIGQSSEPQVYLNPATAGLHAVENIDYDAKGQRTRIDYGNKVFIRYEYDPDTFRLIHLLTQRNTTDFPGDCPQQPPDGWPGCQVQNLHYTYDPVGNITHIRDDAQQTVYFKNKRVEPSADYTYDAIYWLIEASGREHMGQQSKPETGWKNEFRTNLEHPHDGQKMRCYTEKYEYDEVGNIMNLIHQANNGNWSRVYSYNEDSLVESGKMNNRLSTTTAGNTTLQYEHDEHGSMTQMPHLPVMEWDFEDQLHVSQRQVVSEEHRVGERTYYVYDASGERVRKVTEREMENGELARKKYERIYLGGFEIYRDYNGNDTAIELERETLHIMDDTQRIAIVETKTVDTNNDLSPLQLIRYQFDNHLGSVSLELDDGGKVISYEEYYPYGSASYEAMDKNIKAAAKRYRYTGKERDEETGLHYHGARYYACWLGRWVSPDPTGLADGTNSYSYVTNRPVNLNDPSGNNGQEFSAQENPLSYPNWEQFADQNKDMFNSNEEARVTWHEARGLDPYKNSSQQLEPAAEEGTRIRGDIPLPVTQTVRAPAGSKPSAGSGGEGGALAAYGIGGDPRDFSHGEGGQMGQGPVEPPVEIETEPYEFMVAGTTVRLVGDENETESQKSQRWVGHNLGIDHMDIYYGQPKDCTIIVTGFALRGTEVSPAGKDISDREHIITLTKIGLPETHGTGQVLRWGLEANRSCDSATDYMRLSCLAESPRPKKPFSMWGNNCQTDIQYAAEGCCLSGYDPLGFNASETNYLKE